jgi:transcriptional regulator with XRE-family HTH domain
VGILAWRVRRVALGLRQRDIADRAGVSQAHYSQLERGEVPPSEFEKAAINRALELPPEVARMLSEFVVGEVGTERPAPTASG